MRKVKEWMHTARVSDALFGQCLTSRQHKYIFLWRAAREEKPPQLRIANEKQCTPDGSIVINKLTRLPLSEAQLSFAIGDGYWSLTICEGWVLDYESKVLNNEGRNMS